MGFDFTFIDKSPEEAMKGIAHRAKKMRETGKPARTVPISKAAQANVRARMAALEEAEQNPENPPKVWDGKQFIPKDKVVPYLQAKVSEAMGPASRAAVFKVEEEIAQKGLSGELDQDIVDGLLGKGWEQRFKAV